MFLALAFALAHQHNQFHELSKSGQSCVELCVCISMFSRRWLPLIYKSDL